MQARLDGALGQARDFHDLLVGQLLNVTKYDQEALVLLQGGDRLLHDVLGFGGFKQHVGATDVRLGRGSALVGQIGAVTSAWLVLSAARQVLDAILGVVGSNAQQPSGQLGFAAE
jgi:hypothetical protein